VFAVRRALVIGLAALTVGAVALAANLLLIGYASNRDDPVGNLSPRITLSTESPTTQSTPATTTSRTPTTTTSPTTTDDHGGSSGGSGSDDRGGGSNSGHGGGGGDDD
jgi:uncharacterized membrane protein YgcG